MHIRLPLLCPDSAEMDVHVGRGSERHTYAQRWSRTSRFSMSTCESYRVRLYSFFEGYSDEIYVCIQGGVSPPPPHRWFSTGRKSKLKERNQIFSRSTLRFRVSRVWKFVGTFWRPCIEYGWIIIETVKFRILNLADRVILSTLIWCHSTVEISNYKYRWIWYFVNSLCEMK